MCARGLVEGGDARKVAGRVVDRVAGLGHRMLARIISQVVRLHSAFKESSQGQSDPLWVTPPRPCHWRELLLSGASAWCCGPHARDACQHLSLWSTYNGTGSRG